MEGVTDGILADKRLLQSMQNLANSLQYQANTSSVTIGQKERVREEVSYGHLKIFSLNF